MKRKGMYIAIMALWGAMAATMMQRVVWMRSGSQKRWDCNVSGNCN